MIRPAPAARSAMDRKAEGLLIMKVTERTERFAAGIRGKERETFGAAGRPDARFPMVTVFIGQPTGEEFSSLVRCRMDKMQPAYERIFKYFIAEAENETGAASCRDLSGDPLSAESVRDHVRELFREETPFKNKLVLLVNYIFNTEYLQEAGGIRQVFDLIEETRKILAFPKQRSKVIFLLNEQLGGEEKAADIKNTIDELYYGQTKDPRLPADDLFLISNKTFTGSYISRAKEGRAIADLLFLFSAAGAEEASAPDHAGVRTIGFNNVEKPTGEIAKISVIALSEGINEKMAAISEHAGDPDRVSKNADKGPDGEAVPQIGRIIERFVKELPPDSVLEKFPRRSSAEAGPVRDPDRKSVV